MTPAPMTPAPMTPAAIALGANLGDARGTLRAAIAGLAACPDVEIRAVSRLWRTAAVGGPDQPDYLNAVLIVQTRLLPAKLLDLCHSLERAAGRERLVRWGPRTLDLDILAFGTFISDDPVLTLPHPRAHERAFVLAPWADVSPDWQLIAQGRTRSVADWLGDVADQSVAVLADSVWWR